MRQGISEFVTFHDLLYYLEIIPIEGNARRKILFEASFYVNYWTLKEPTISLEWLVFVLEKIGVQGEMVLSEKFDRNRM